MLGCVEDNCWNNIVSVNVMFSNRRRDIFDMFVVVLACVSLCFGFVGCLFFRSILSHPACDRFYLGVPPRRFRLVLVYRVVYIVSVWRLVRYWRAFIGTTTDILFGALKHLE